MSALIARDIPNHELERFQTSLAQGEILLILHLKKQRVNEIVQLIKTTHPEAKISIIDATISPRTITSQSHKTVKRV